MNETSEVPKVFAAICAVQGALSKIGVAKDKKNVSQGFTFRGIDDVYGALAPLLAEHKLVIIPRFSRRVETDRQTAKGGSMLHVVVEGVYVFCSAEDGSQTESLMYGEAMDSGDKATNKAMSAAYKYMAFQVFCIPLTGEDADATTPPPSDRKHVVPGGNPPRPPEKSTLQILPPPNAPFGDLKVSTMDNPPVAKAYKDMTNGEKVDYWCTQFASSKTTGELDVYSQSLIAAELSGGAIRGDVGLKAAYSVASARLHREGK